MMNKKALLVVAALFSASNTATNTVEAYTNSHDLRRQFGVTHSKSKSSPPSTSSSSPHTIAHAALDTTDPFASQTNRRQSPPSSSSASPAAHGILSPETVARMVENTAHGRKTNPAVDHFLTTYRRKGPMSCLEMLSDPEVLPHLTQAMRDVL